MGSISAPRSIRLAVLAMGGEGGGVLADWIVSLAEHADFHAQTTSVPGVAQRTGATIYYIELFPGRAAKEAQRPPVLALTPIPGDVDIVIASELMEAGRAVQRGIVTPDKTTLIASTHRVFAMTEKIALGDGRTDAPAIYDACRSASKRMVAFDMAAMAQQTGSVISAVMFGSLAGANVLPFGREQFEATIERGGVGVTASKRAFDLGYRAALEGRAPDAAIDSPRPQLPESSGGARVEIDSFPVEARAIIGAGVERLIGYQDKDYATLYLDRLRAIADIDRERPERHAALLTEVARHLALGMAYEDVVRVAELKIRASRFDRVRQEVGLKDGQILKISEYLHPRLQEIAETVPAPLGRFILRFGPLRWLIEKATQKGRVVTTTSIGGFLLLYITASLKSRRRASMRYAEEQSLLEQWLALTADLARKDYALALEFAECRNLVKGYSDTHARGKANYLSIASKLEAIAAQAEPAASLAALRRAALADDTGVTLATAIASLEMKSSDQRMFAGGVNA